MIVLGGYIGVFNLTDPTSLSQTYYEHVSEQIRDADIFELDGRTYALVTLFGDALGRLPKSSCTT